MRNHYPKYVFPLFLACWVLVGANSILGSEKEYGVYEYVIRKAQGTYEQITVDLEAAAAKSGWKVVAVVDAGVMKDCPSRARVFVLYDSLYARDIMDANRNTGPFAVLDRINLFQDEEGNHVSIVNPHSINRTILMDDQKYEAMTVAHLQALRTMITSAVKGEESRKQYGEMRDRGYIGKTMGIIAGGKFEDKVEDVFVIPGGNWKDVADKVEEGLSKPGKEWGTHVVYRAEMPGFETALLGATGTPMDTKSFDIVGEGGDDSRDQLSCPGFAHAAAYPIEIVVTQETTDVQVRMVHAMFRMKMYFEDAGNWAFMKHMGMPGSIADEIESALAPMLKAKNVKTVR